MLRMASAREFGDARRLDKYMVALPHPEAMNALLSKQHISAHFATPPYLDQEVAASMKLVLDSVDAVGEPYSGQVMVASMRFHDKHPEASKAVTDALAEAIAWIAANPDEAAALGSVLNRGFRWSANHDSSSPSDGGLDVEALLAE